MVKDFGSDLEVMSEFLKVVFRCIRFPGTVENTGVPG
jgi:hypothetical protein